MSKENLDKVVHLANIASVVVVAISVIAILSAIFFFFYPKKETEIINVKVHYTYSIVNSKSIKDSIGIKYNVSEINKNNKEVYRNINKRIEDFENKHKDNIQASKNQTDFVSYASAIFALIVAIAGFFGFKSINDMKKAAVESAIKKSQEVSEENIEKFFKNDIKTITKEAFQDVAISIIDPLDNRINDLQARIDECCEERERPNDNPIFNVDDDNEPFNENQI